MQNQQNPGVNPNTNSQVIKSSNPKKSPLENKKILMIAGLLIISIVSGGALIAGLSFLKGKESVEDKEEFSKGQEGESEDTATEEVEEHEDIRCTDLYLGFTVEYPDNYKLETRNLVDEAKCVTIEKGAIRIIIGSKLEEIVVGCFRTGVGAYEIEKTNVSYTNGKDYQIEEWYEQTEDPDGNFGIIYGTISPDPIDGKEWALEYWGSPEEDFDNERETIKAIIESIKWGNDSSAGTSIADTTCDSDDNYNADGKSELEIKCGDTITLSVSYKGATGYEPFDPIYDSSILKLVTFSEEDVRNNKPGGDETVHMYTFQAFDQGTASIKAGIHQSWYSAVTREIQQNVKVTVE